MRSSPAARCAAKVIGIGEIGASALTASVGDFSQFKACHQFGAWLGIVPRQNSSGGKTSLGRITKRGDDYLRTLLIQGAKSAVMSPPNATTRSRAGWSSSPPASAGQTGGR